MNFYGNQLNYLDTFYRIGYALFLIPSQLVLTKVRASYWLPPLELAWGLMTGEHTLLAPPRPRPPADRQDSWPPCPL